MTEPPSPIRAEYNPNELIDSNLASMPSENWDLGDFYLLAERIRQSNRPAVVPPKRSILALSGGGMFGAYSAGVLVGWTATGTRPKFDVVTGISTGALIAPFAFLGSEYDDELRKVYTTLNRRDIFKIRRAIRIIFADSLADTEPLAMKIDEIITPEILKAIAMEHAKGRRMYIGTTELESRRSVIWDMGEIATRGREQDLELFRKILLASTAIPGFFPPVKIPVFVDGVDLQERHIDGGVTNALFFRPPYVPPEYRDHPFSKSLYDSDLYLLIAGKLFADPSVVNPRALRIAANSVSTLIYSQTRGDMLKMYTACIVTGMNYYSSSIPQDFKITTRSTDFDPVEMNKLFDEGYRQVTSNSAWRRTPPGIEAGENNMIRTGNQLTKVPLAVQQQSNTIRGPWIMPNMTNRWEIPYSPQPPKQ